MKGRRNKWDVKDKRGERDDKGTKIDIADEETSCWILNGHSATNKIRPTWREWLVLVVYPKGGDRLQGGIVGISSVPGQENLLRLTLFAGNPADRVSNVFRPKRVFFIWNICLHNCSGSEWLRYIHITTGNILYVCVCVCVRVLSHPPANRGPTYHNQRSCQLTHSMYLVSAFTHCCITPKTISFDISQTVSRSDEILNTARSQKTYFYTL